jgi:hypothetical protein
MNERVRARLQSTTDLWLGLLLVVFAFAAKALCQLPTALDGSFYVYRDAGMSDTNHFVPSGIMGDTGDIAVDEGWSTNPYSGKTSIRIQYNPKFKGPSKCDHYDPPCKWAGIYWQEPANNWGENENLRDRGYNLSEYRVLRFSARTDTHCDGGKCSVKFMVGGIDKKYGDSLKSGRSVDAPLTEKWCPFEIDLNNANLRHIIGGFSFAVAQRDFPRGLTIYLDEIRFEKK